MSQKKQAVDADTIDLDNPELQKALQIIQFTNNSLFLTGKAGTGKSTFLRYISAITKKKHVILAPTGIAAINAGGSTLHSFFKLPFYPLVPTDKRYSTRNLRSTMKYNGDKCKLLREVELIIIDEISMVRADIIDFIDKVLRIYNRNMREPFGGKQLLLVGDIYQLEPVLKEEDRQLLQPYYASSYFFDAKVFQNYPLVSIELNKVYRQNDPSFISILDHIRTNQVSDNDLRYINARVGAQRGTTEIPQEDFTITLSTRRDTVDWINNQGLDSLNGAPVMFLGEIKGEFPESSLPTPIELNLKVGAHVMFIKNDTQKQWVNGTLGLIIGIDEEAGILYVHTEDGDDLQVQREIWENVRYHFNETEQKIEEEQIGTYVQFPIKLAWAITVHKSQGLTFRNVNIDFTGGVFAGGQAYVALSRCTSLEGITLKEPLHRNEVFVRSEVVQFARHYNDHNIISAALRQSKADKEYYDAARAFDKGDFDTFLHSFFLAIHSRYDIEHPSARRLIRRKLNIINCLRSANRQLQEQLAEQKAYLKKLSVEYVLMGKECEHEGMTDAAIANYRKAVALYPDNPTAQKRLKKLTSSTEKKK
ncbi:AAA family ATPase [Prevotella denticola]|uniref:AAA family ATPase n=1 Tax=Prevotella denticola TaxID=28129 RepID=UPI0028DB4005|nr:AAA family ATPase [Prevotella denticola]